MIKSDKINQIITFFSIDILTKVFLNT